MSLVGKFTNTTYYYWNENERLEKDAAALAPLNGRKHVDTISYWRFMTGHTPLTAFNPITE